MKILLVIEIIQPALSIPTIICMGLMVFKQKLFEKAFALF